MGDLLELAERCEAAEGVDRELDVAVTCAAYKWRNITERILPAQSGGGRCVHYYNSGTHGTSAAPRYTGDIKAILHHLDLGGELESFEASVLTDDRWVASLATENGEGACNASAATKELALLSAALRARANA